MSQEIPSFVNDMYKAKEKSSLFVGGEGEGKGGTWRLGKGPGRGERFWRKCPCGSVV